MPTGPGKYDDLCTYVRVQAKALAAIIIVFDGSKGGGFSVQIADDQLTLMREIPKMLRYIADEIERPGVQ